MLEESRLGEGVAMGISRATEDAQETLPSRPLGSPTQASRVISVAPGEVTERPGHGFQRGPCQA